MVIAIAAVDKQLGIGYKNELLTKIPEDLIRFKKFTQHHTIVMGRKTWESLPDPLPNRRHIIITNKVNSIYKESENIIFMNMEDVKAYLTLNSEDTIYIIGGATIYKQLLPFCDYIYLTKIYKTYSNVDSYFPKIEQDNWLLLKQEPLKSYDQTLHQFCVYKRI